jgi:hypothetical protein
MPAAAGERVRLTIHRRGTRAVDAPAEHPFLMLNWTPRVKDGIRRILPEWQSITRPFAQSFSDVKLDKHAPPKRTI